MCIFPSWIVDSNNKAWWLTDKDVEAYCGDNAPNWDDLVGHYAIKKVYGATGKHLEGFIKDLPEGFISDINKGKCQKMMLAGGYKKVYIKYGVGLHREDGPALEYVDGSKKWYIDGQLHREDGPAIEWSDCYKKWYLNGQLHREDGPAIEWSDGSKEWWINGQLHREDGPAIEYVDGIKEWWINGQRYRKNRSAIEYVDDNKKYEHSFFAKEFDDFLIYIKSRIVEKFKNLKTNTPMWKDLSWNIVHHDPYELYKMAKALDKSYTECQEKSHSKLKKHDVR